MKSGRLPRELRKELAREPAQERTFAEVFPWRNIGRALMLVVVILAIVGIQRSAGSWLARVGDLLGSSSSPPSSLPPRPGVPAFNESAAARVRLGPGLAPSPAAARTADIQTH